MTDRIEAAEKWPYRRILKISNKDHIKDEDILKRMSVKKQLINIIRNFFII